MNEVETELTHDVDFNIIRYAQCWEDANVVLDALQVSPGDVCLSVASAGDNTLSLLTQDPSRVIAIDLSVSQLACLEIRVAAYRQLTYTELLELMGARPSSRRRLLYERIAPALSERARSIWETQGPAIEIGIANLGKFERYLDMIRRYAVNPTHSKQDRDELFRPRSVTARKTFYDIRWNNWLWRLLIRIICSRVIMGHFGRDPRFFKYAHDSVSDHIMRMTEHVLVDLPPTDNPYLHWIVQGYYGEQLPHSLQEKNVHHIRANLDRLEWHLIDVQTYLDSAEPSSISRYNFSDVFEYLSGESSDVVFESVARTGVPGGRLAYWNMLVPRHRPARLEDKIKPLPMLSEQLHRAARTFFYTGFVVEEII